MDEIDKKIIALLSENSRLPASEIGKQVHRSRVAVAKRIDALISSGEIAAFSLIKRRNTCPVIFEVLLKTNGRCDILVPKFRENFSVTKAWSVSGASDLFLWCEAKIFTEVHDMRNFLLSQSEVLKVTSHSITKTFE